MKETHPFSGTGQVVFDGPQDEDAYLRWLKEQYGTVIDRFPPASIVCFDGDEVHEFMVVSYHFADGVASVGIVDLAVMKTTPYEDLDTVNRKVCPVHELPALKYLYNVNGDAFVEKVRAIKV